MKTVQNTLYSIVLLLAGIACLLLESLEGSGVFGIVGVLLAIVGLGIATAAFFSSEPSPETKDEEKSETKGTPK